MLENPQNTDTGWIIINDADPTSDPQLIKEETEARDYFKLLTKMGFQVRAPQLELDEAGLILTLKGKPVEIGIKLEGQLNDCKDFILTEMFLMDALLDPSRAYNEFAAEGYVPFVVGPVLEEEEFIKIVFAAGTVDLSRISRNLKTGEPILQKNGEIREDRYFGSKIGWSSPAQKEQTRQMVDLFFK